MAISIAGIMLSLLLLSCLISFAWAMRNFFHKPDRMTPGIRLTAALGTTFGLLHLAFVLLFTKNTLLGAGLAAAIYLSSLALFWSTIRANKKKPLSACFSKSEQLHLVQHGPYRLVRHPFYCSYLLAWLGGVVATRSPWLFVTFVVMYVLYKIAASSEEQRFLSGPFASQYEAYKNRTGQFFPAPWKLLMAKSAHAEVHSL